MLAMKYIVLQDTCLKYAWIHFSLGSRNHQNNLSNPSVGLEHVYRDIFLSSAQAIGTNGIWDYSCAKTLLFFFLPSFCSVPSVVDSPTSHVCRNSHLYTLCVPVFLIPSWFTFGLYVVFVSANEGSFYSFIQSASISCLWILSPSPPTLTICSFVY